MAPTPTLGSHPPERGPRPCPGHTSSRRGQWHRQTRHLAAHGPQGDGTPTPPPPTGEAQLWPSSPEGWGRRRCPDRKWGLQWSPGPQKRLLLPASFPGSQGGAAGAAGRSPQSLFSGLSRLAAFGGSRATPSLLPPAVPPPEEPGFLSKPRAGVTRPPSSEETWPLGPTKLSSASHLQTPVPSRRQLVSAGRAAGRTGPPGSARV